MHVATLLLFSASNVYLSYFANSTANLRNARKDLVHWPLMEFDHKYSVPMETLGNLTSFILIILFCISIKKRGICTTVARNHKRNIY